MYIQYRDFCCRDNISEDHAKHGTVRAMCQVYSTICIVTWIIELYISLLGKPQLLYTWFSLMFWNPFTRKTKHFQHFRPKKGRRHSALTERQQQNRTKTHAGRIELHLVPGYKSISVERLNFLSRKKSRQTFRKLCFTVRHRNYFTSS